MKLATIVNTKNYSNVKFEITQQPLTDLSFFNLKQQLQCKQLE